MDKMDNKMDNKKTQKTQKKYTCEICDFYTSNRTDFNRHILTRKHENRIMDNSSKKWITTKKSQKNKKKNQQQKNGNNLTKNDFCVTQNIKPYSKNSKNTQKKCNNYKKNALPLKVTNGCEHNTLMLAQNDFSVKKNAKNDKKNALLTKETTVGEGTNTYLDNQSYNTNTTDNLYINNVSKKFPCLCGKEYKYQSGLCKHRHICPLIKQMSKDNSLNNKKTEIIISDKGDRLLKDSNLTVDMFNTALEQQQQLLNTIVELSKDRNTTNNYTNCNNKKMTINVFLNEQCKDAMNLKDFVDNVKVSLEDLLYTKEHGYVKGISNIFVKHLKDMDPKDRPIHCTDRKRLQFYIKDENKWGKDSDNVKIDKSIDDVSRKQVRQLVEWQKQHPNYENNDKLLNEYFKIARHVMSGGNIDEVTQNTKVVMKTIGGKTEIRDAMDGTPDAMSTGIIQPKD